MAKRGDYGMLGLTAEQESMQKFVGIKPESENEPEARSEQEDSKTQLIEENEKPKPPGHRGFLGISPLSERAGIKIAEPQTELTDPAKAETNEDAVVVEEAKVEVSKTQDETEKGPDVRAAWAGFMRQAKEYVAVKLQSMTEKLKEKVEKIKVKPQEIVDQPNVKASEVSETEMPKEQQSPAEQMGESILKDTEAKVQKLQKRLDELDTERQKLEEIKAQLQEYIQQINNVLEQKRAGNGDSNEKDDNDFAPESKAEQRELRGNKSVAAAIEVYGQDRISHDVGREWFHDKFKDGQVNNADRLVALSILEEQQEENEINGEVEDNNLANAIEHLREYKSTNEDWIQDEGKVSNYLELRARLLGRDDDLVTQVEQLRTVNNENDTSKVELSLDVIKRLNKDKSFKQTIGPDAEVSMRKELARLSKSLQKRKPQPAATKTKAAAA